MKSILRVTLVLLALNASAQTTYYMQGLLRQPDADTAKAYLKITNSSGGGGAGSVSNFLADNFSPLFTTSVATPTSTPHLSFSPISQSQNRVYASPDGAAGTPTFRSLTTGDLPDISTIVRGDVSATTPVLYDSVTGIFSMHVADASHNGYLSLGDWSTFNSKQSALTFGNLTDAGTDGITVTGGAGAVIGTGTSFAQHVADASHNGYLSLGDWSTFNGKGSGTLTSVTNASFGLLGASIISSSNGPVPSFKSISGGGSTTVTDNGTNIVVSSTSGGGGSSGIDVTQTNLLTFANVTNFVLDFNWQAQKLIAPSDISFNYSTNWPGSSSTSRWATVFIPATNYLRHVSFVTAATNWHVNTPLLYNIPAFRSARLVCQAFGQGDTNVTLTPFIDDKNDPTLTNILDLSSLTAIASATNVLWVDATRGVYQDAFLTAPAQDGMNVLGWSDFGGQGNNLTNNTSTFNSIYFHNAATAPLNVPCLSILPPPSSLANTWLRSPTVTKLTQPVWVFMMVHGNKSSANGANVIDSISGSTTRLLCTVGFKDLCTIASANTSSFQVTNSVVGKWELMAFKFNSTTSQVLTNSVSIITNNAGTGVGNGFTFGSDIVSTIPSSQTDVAEVAVFWGNLTAADLGNIQTNYFRVKYGAW